MLFPAYVVHPTYVTVFEEGKKRAVVTLWCRLADGRSALVRKPFVPYFFIPAKMRKVAEGLLGGIEASFIDAALEDFSGRKVVRVETAVPADVPKLREAFEKVGISCFEADIRFAYRAMMDWGVHATCVIDGEGRKPVEGERVDVVFEDPAILPGACDVPLRICSFDIESDKDAGDLFCVSAVLEDGKKRVRERLVMSDVPVKDARHFADELSLLEALAERIRSWDPDVVTGWNVIDFDLAHLNERAKLHGVRLQWGRDASAVKLRLESSFFRDSSAVITGRVVIDGIQLLRNSFVKLPNFKLATAAREFTDQLKLIESTGAEKYEEITRLYAEDKEALLKYNEQDAELVLDIFKGSGAFELTVKRSFLVGMPLDRVNASIASLDSLYLRRLRERGLVAPSSGSFARDNEGVGGFVMQSRPGIYDYVIVCDFKSLYPSIMRTFNIDPAMFVPDESAEKAKKGELIRAPNGAHFRRELGIIPELIQMFWDEREEARKAKDELARYAIKIHMNAIYGVMASPNCRFFNRAVGNAITGFAQMFIKLAAQKAKEMGYEVIYGDTDSLFINLDADEYDAAQRIGKGIEEGINIFLREHIRKEYALDSFLELEFEKTFIRFVMPRVRGSDSGAKKRYAGLVRKEDGSEDISFTGLEMVRRDWTDLAKEFQYELYRRVFHKEEVAEYVRQVIKDLQSGKLDDKLVYHKALRKGVDQYTKTTPPHVKAAMKLDRIESNIIEYVLTVEGPEPVQKVEHSIDYNHYIDKQLKPIADSILVFYNTSFDDQVKGSTQSSLFEF